MKSDQSKAIGNNDVNVSWIISLSDHFFDSPNPPNRRLANAPKIGLAWDGEGIFFFPAANPFQRKRMNVFSANEMNRTIQREKMLNIGGEEDQAFFL